MQAINTLVYFAFNPHPPCTHNAVQEFTPHRAPQIARCHLVHTQPTATEHFKFQCTPMACSILHKPTEHNAMQHNGICPGGHPKKIVQHLFNSFSMNHMKAKTLFFHKKMFHCIRHIRVSPGFCATQCSKIF